jgi:hypothetical protein
LLSEAHPLEQEAQRTRVFSSHLPMHHGSLGWYLI